MPFKLPNRPSPQATTSELADFAELISWEQGAVSDREIVAYLGRIDDNDSDDGCDNNEDENREFVDSVMNELELRKISCGGGYPYTLERNGSVLRDSFDAKDARHIVYRYCLLSTRLNMTSDRRHAKIDGTLLLEELSAHVLRTHLGKRAKALVFGTATQSNFPDRIKKLVVELGEGGQFRPLDGDAVIRANDDKLDVVAWIPFEDRRPCQLIIFAQCKTGTNWRTEVTQLQPTQFNTRWCSRPFLVAPITAFLVSESVGKTYWMSTCTSTGIFFDRCRIVEHCETASLSKVSRWVAAAKASFQLIKC